MTAPARPLRADARRNRESVLDAASELFARRGDDVQMDEIAAKAGLGVGTLYRHFADKEALRAAIIGRRFQAMVGVADAAEQLDDPEKAFASLLEGYLTSVEADAAFRFAILDPKQPTWSDIAAEKAAFSGAVLRIVQRAVDAGLLRADFTEDDFVLVTRGAMANMSGNGDWRRHLSLQLDGIRRPAQ